MIGLGGASAGTFVSGIVGGAFIRRKVRQIFQEAVEAERLGAIKITREGELENMVIDSHNSYTAHHSKLAQMLPPGERERLLGTTQQGLFVDSTPPIPLNQETANQVETGTKNALITLIKDDPLTINTTIALELARLNTADWKAQGGATVSYQFWRVVHGPSYEFRAVRDGIMQRTPRGHLSKEDFNAVIAESERQALGSTVAELCIKRKTGAKITCADGTPASSSNPFLYNFEAVWSYHAVTDKTKTDVTSGPVEVS